MSRRFAYLILGLLLRSLFDPHLAAAQPNTQPDTQPNTQPDAPASTNTSEEAPALTPPELLEFVPAVYPAAAEAAGTEASVELAITIEADGSVGEAEVITPAGEGFDEAARAAVLQFRFRPAMRAGAPLRVRIRYRYVFSLAAEEIPGALEGRVLHREDDAPLPAHITLRRAGDDPLLAETDTDAEGGFSFDGLAGGEYLVSVESPGLETRESPELVVDGEVTALLYRLSPSVDDTALDTIDDEETDLGFGATAEIDPPPREVTRRTIRASELTRIPGTRGDALRAVEILPGVGRPPPFAAGQLLIRGSSTRDSQVFINNSPAPLLYHFGGLTSTVNSRLLDRIDFIPGNFSARYGRKFGGILDVQTRDPRTDGFHGVLELGVLDASILAELPLHETVGVALGFRRSTMDLILPAVLPDDAFSFVTYPVYYDYQAMLTWRPTSRDRVSFAFLGSDDDLLVELDDTIDDNALLTGDIQMATRSNLFQLGYEHTFSPATEIDIDIQAGPVRTNFGVGNSLTFQGDFTEATFRGELRHRFHERVRLIAGADVHWSPYTFRFVGPPLGQEEGAGNETPLVAADVSEEEFSGQLAQPGVYLETDLQLHEDFRVVLGARLDYESTIAEWAFDPRLVFFASLPHGITLKGGAGLYSQPPEVQEMVAETGNPELEWMHALHLSLGLEIEPPELEGFELSLEGFYKQLWDRVVSTEGGLAPYYDNAGVGRIYGMEFSAKYDPPGRGFYGYLAYTFSRSERRDRPGDAWRLFDFDQTHILSATALYQLPRDWEIGASFRFVTGNPMTPVNGASLDLISDAYTPVDGAVNSSRNADYHRLDLRVEKQWVFDTWKIALFLDIQNVYSRQSPEGQMCRYDYDPDECLPVGGLPIVPALGIRGEL